MSKTLSQTTDPGVFVFVFAAVAGTGQGIYSALGIDAAGFALLRWISVLCVFGWWMKSDSKTHQVKLVYDIGFYLCLAWPFVVLYYLFKTRGIRALLVIGAFVGVYVGPVIVGLVVRLLLGGQLPSS